MLCTRRSTCLPSSVDQCRLCAFRVGPSYSIPAAMMQVSKASVDLHGLMCTIYLSGDDICSLWSADEEGFLCNCPLTIEADAAEKIQGDFEHSRARLAMALFPLRNPITEATGYFGGIAMRRNRCTTRSDYIPLWAISRRRSSSNRGHWMWERFPTLHQTANSTRIGSIGLSARKISQ